MAINFNLTGLVTEKDINIKETKDGKQEGTLVVTIYDKDALYSTQKNSKYKKVKIPLSHEDLQKYYSSNKNDEIFVKYGKTYLFEGIIDYFTTKNNLLGEWKTYTIVRALNYKEVNDNGKPESNSISNNN